MPGAGDDSLPVLDKSVGGTLIVVSNRLPVTISRNEDGTYNFKLSSGGLVSALSGCKKQMDFTWIGWPGLFRPHTLGNFSLEALCF
jgi:trehalose 6-phosphate synthase